MQKTQLWQWMLLVFIAALCLRVPLASLGPVIETIAHDLVLSRAQASLILTIPVVCMGFCALLAQPLSAYIGLERTIALCLVAAAIGVIIRSASHSIWIIGLGSFVIGTSIAITGPLISGFIKRYLSRQTARGMMLYSLGISMSGLLGTLTTLPLMHYFNWQWSTALLFWALPVALVGMIWMGCFMSKAGHLVQEIPVKLPWKNWRAWVLLIGFSLQSGTFYSLLAWLMPYLIENNFSATKANTLLNVFMITGPVGSIFFPLLLSKQSRQLVILACGIPIIFSLFMLSIAPSFMTYFVIALLGATANGGMFITILSLPFYEVDNVNGVASWTAMILSVGYLLSAITPTFFGFLRDATGSYQSVMWGMVGSAILMTGLLFYICTSKPKQ